MNGKSFGLERLGHLCLRAPKTAMLVIAGLTLLALFGLFRISFDDDLRNLLRTDAEVFGVYDRFSDDFPDLENQILLLVEADDLVDAERLETIRALHLDLRFVDGVTSVLSLFTARHPPDAAGVLAPLFPDDLPQDRERLLALVEAARMHPLLGGKIISSGNDATLLVVSVEPDLRAYGPLSGLLADIQETIAFATRETGVSVVATGAPVLRYELLRTIRTDLHFLNLLGAAISIFVCILFFRRMSWVLLASVAPLLGVIWTLGAFGLAGWPVTAMSNVLPTLVLVIGFSDALHMVNSIRRNMASGLAVKEACSISVTEVGPACAITSVTTIIALLSLLLSDSESVRDFGLAGSVAVLIAFVVVIALIPSMAVVMLARTEVSPRLVEPAKSLVMARQACEAAWRFADPRSGFVSAASLALLIITGIGFFSLEPTYSYREYLSPYSPANKAVERVNSRLGGAEIIFGYVQAQDQNEGQAAVHLDTVTAVHDAFASVSGVANVLSLSSVTDWLTQGSEGAAPNIDAALAELPDRFNERFVSDDGQAWLISAYVPAAPAPETRALLARIEAALLPVREAARGYAINVTGIATLAATESGPLIEGLRNSLAIAILAIVLVIALTTRTFLLALFSAVPNLISLSIVAAALAVLGAGFQFTSAIALTVAFGIAVDNTVHLVHRYRLERRSLATGDALAQTLRRVGPVLVAATAVLTLGMCVTQFSELPMVVLFGRLCMVILFTALVATIVVLPAVIQFAAKSYGSD